MEFTVDALHAPAGPCPKAPRRPGSRPPLHVGRQRILQPPRTALPGVDDPTIIRVPVMVGIPFPEFTFVCV